MVDVITLKLLVHHLIYQYSLNGRELLTNAEVKESQVIASVRIYLASYTTC